MSYYLEIIGGLGFIIVFLLSLIANYLKKNLNEQKINNEHNKKEHASINLKLEKGKIWFDEIIKDLNENKGNIKTLDHRVNKHDIKIVEIEGKMKLKAK